MGNCIITRLKESVEDDSLVKLGELRINIESDESPTSGTRGIRIRSVTDQTISIVEGDAFFTDSTLLTNKGKTLNLTANTTAYVYISNSKCILSIPDKYNLNLIMMTKADENYENHKFSFDIADLSGCAELEYLALWHSDCYGDIKELSTAVKLKQLNLAYKEEFYGDIAAFENCPALQTISIYGTNISGDIASIKNCTALTSVSLTNSKVSGNIGELGTLTNVTRLLVSNTFVSGSISNLSTCTNLEYLEIKYLQLSGDLSLMPSKMYFISNQNGTGTFTWQNTRANNYRILAMENINLGQYVDAMLINQADCTAYNAGSAPAYKIIKVTGEKTSSSDSAVSTLGTKGYTVVAS